MTYYFKYEVVLLFATELIFEEPFALVDRVQNAKLYCRENAPTAVLLI